jgi:hypothetical protein
MNFKNKLIYCFSMHKKSEFIPKKPWQGSQSLELRLRIPCDVVMLCKLMDTEPEILIKNFLSCLALEKDSKTPQLAKEACIEFFIRYGYGKEYYSEQEVRQMFKELGAVNDLWPEQAPPKFIEHHSNWRKKYWKQWFKKWFWKIRRKKSKHFSLLEKTAHP